MSRKDRAKQFAPFDALKGLQKALRLKEFEHEIVEKGDVSEENLNKISTIFLNLKKSDVLKIKYYCDGHYFEIKGNCKLEIENNQLVVKGKKIKLDDVYDVNLENSD